MQTAVQTNTPYRSPGVPASRSLVLSSDPTTFPPVGNVLALTVPTVQPELKDSCRRAAAGMVCVIQQDPLEAKL